ncbi:hypothetical protein ABZW11_26425 [Nonomuraea sp. NPDC004580]|uniref:hypothetical protein n=1 Tax=Nonomuraea sp. NPDC004580 TaxID=3154552 RepID=UPI00339FEB82
MGDYYENALTRAFRDEVADVEPRYVLPTIVAAARRREAWLVALVATVAVLGALLIVVGLLLLRGQDQPAPAPSPSSSTRLWEA